MLVPSRVWMLAVATTCTMTITAPLAVGEPRLNRVRPAATGVCSRVIASSASYANVKLVGIVHQGRKRKALVTVDTKSFVIQPGECIGRERVPYERILEQMQPPFDDHAPQTPQKLPPDVG